jgi:hypothetical protein
MNLATKDRTATTVTTSSPDRLRVEPGSRTNRRTVAAIAVCSAVAAIALGAAGIAAQRAATATPDRPAPTAAAVDVDDSVASHGGPGSVRLAASEATSASTTSAVGRAKLAHLPR